MAQRADLFDSPAQKNRRQRSREWRSRTIVQILGELRQFRPLTAEEKEIMSRASYGLGPKSENWRWTEKEDRLLLLVIKRWDRLSQRRPFARNDTVRQLAAQTGRSEWAIYRRMERLRKQRKCSNAETEAKG